MFVPRLTLPHRFDFGPDAGLVGGDLQAPDSWDRLRLDTSGAFAAADDPAALLAEVGAQPQLVQRAGAIADVLAGRSLASYGAGAGVLERCLLDAGVALTVTEYAPRTVQRLTALLPEATVVTHDLDADPPIPADLHLLHRVDTELGDAAWRRLFERFGQARVLVVPAGIVEPRALPATLVHLARTRGATRAGWLRTRPALLSLWSRTHRGTRLDLAGAEAWLLEPRR